MNLTKAITTVVVFTLFIFSSACDRAHKYVDKYAGVTETDKIVEAVILQGSFMYSVNNSLTKIYVSSKNDRVRRNRPVVWLSHLLENHYFSIVDSAFLFAQNNGPVKKHISPALRKKLNMNKKTSPSKTKSDDEDPPGYCVLCIPIISKDGNTAFITAANYCGHCMYTDDYFLKKSKDEWHVVARKYYRETDGG